MSTALRNMEKCIHDVGLQVDGFVFSGLAAAEVTLTETEKELGVVAVDIAAGSTSICVYIDGALSYSAALPIGARHITQDIALGCRISLDSAEKMKLALSSDEEPILSPFPGESKEDFGKRKKRADQLDIASLGIEEKTEILSKRRALIEGIMVPRMKEIFGLIGQQLNAHDLLSQFSSMSISTGTTELALGPATRPDGRESSPASWIYSGAFKQRTRWRRRRNGLQRALSGSRWAGRNKMQ